MKNKYWIDNIIYAADLLCNVYLGAYIIAVALYSVRAGHFVDLVPKWDWLALAALLCFIFIPDREQLKKIRQDQENRI